jgi:hypothetical protein
MFGDLIRRKIGFGQNQPSEVALDAATFSLTTDVPRPTDSRADERLLALLPVARLVSDEWQDLCRIRNISAGGLMAETTVPHASNVPVTVELNSNQHIAGSIVWVRDTTVGIKFDQNVDLREVLANRRPRIGFRPRPARLDIKCNATIQIGSYYHKVEVRDISLGGIKVRLHERDLVGREVMVTVESLRPIKGAIRWHQDGMAGIVFQRPLTFDELAEWLGKRIEVASLRASTQPLAARPNRAA